MEHRGVTFLPLTDAQRRFVATEDDGFAEASRELVESDQRGEFPAAAPIRPSQESESVDEVAAQEIPTGAEDLVVWDVSPDEAGHLVEPCEAEDESTVQATMAEQGRDDADRDLRGSQLPG